MRIPAILKNLKESLSLILVVISAVAMFFLQFFLKESVGSFVAVAIPTILLTLFFSLIALRLFKFEERIQTILNSRLPEISFIDDEEILKKEFMNAVEESEQFIVATGGKSGLVDYLNMIEKMITEERIFYRRIVTGKKITPEMFTHLSRVINQKNVRLRWNEREYLPMLLITEKVVIFSLPDPIRGQFDTCMKIPNKVIVDRVKLYADEWMLESKPIMTLSELKKLV